MVNKQNYYQEYVVYAQYQIFSTKVVVQVDFPHMHYLSTNKTSLKKQSVKHC